MSSSPQRVPIPGLAFALCAMSADVPQRLVSLPPDLIEMLYSVGAFNRVVSNYETYPAEAANLPRRFSRRPDEGVIAANPEVIGVQQLHAIPAGVVKRETAEARA